MIIPEDTVTRIIPPKILVLMTGVLYVDQGVNKTTLIYTDGTRESAVLTNKERGKDFIGLVSAVQSRRKLAGAEPHQQNLAPQN